MKAHRARPSLTHSHSAGFTLVEMLTVIFIASVLIALTSHGIRGVLESRNLARSAAMISEQLGLARQMAASSNTRVRWQLLRVSRRAGEDVAYRCLRIQKFNASSRQWEDATAPEWLPEPFGVDERIDKSSLLQPPLDTNERSSVTVLPSVRIGDQLHSNVSVLEITFLSDGRTTLNPNRIHFLTLRSLNPGGDAPHRVATLQINPITGRCSTYLP